MSGAGEPATRTTVHLPRSLVELFPGMPTRLESEARTVESLLAELNQEWPGTWERLCDTGPIIRGHLNVFVNGERADLSSPLPPAAVVRIIPAVSGG